ncbi:hypothetical protein T281_08135 [Rhodomicrobium udaipurense JA643]|uniref:Uncharacterized protein n=1 Tax=Rhodomicrobium udaipurense TaxID=1202716 RepID=A0A8I1KJ95_9HYPH|nr:hypothetical protein [Rhodomicrobium udaipurense]KAI94956.1 hypothetical protein T281_08135 [Rhodomicrobium udaipurense JA643]MBJ7542619.1 hypothetical protein [Rhodomicrobium udaipurense]
MRKVAFAGLAAVAVSLFTPMQLWAWSSEPVQQNSDAAAALNDDDKLKALQDKVDGKGEFKSGFYVSGGAASGSYASPFGSQQNLMNSGVPYGYSPMPGFRGISR